MNFLRKLDLRISQIPELAGLGVNEKKLAIRACRWKVFRVWQYWLTVILCIPFSMIFLGIVYMWYIDLSFEYFNRMLISMLAFISILSIILICYLEQQILIYYVAPFIMRSIVSGSGNHEIQLVHKNSQKLRKKAIKKGLILFVLTVLLVVILLKSSFQNMNFLEPRSLKMPEALKSPRIVKSMQGMTKKTFLEDARLGDVTDISFRGPINRNLDEMVLSGTNGALFKSKDLPARFVPFEERQDSTNYIPLDSKGTFGFMNRGAWCSEARVMNIAGRLIWRYGGFSGVDDMASGDINNDGNPEFAVGFNGDGGIHLLNSQGKMLWKFSDGNVWHVEMADIYGNGQKMIVHSNAGGYITVRDVNGKVVSKNKPKPYFSDFSLIRWPKEHSPELLLLVEDNSLWIFNAKATQTVKFPAPDSGSLGEGKGVIIAINRENSALATIVNYEIWHRSIIYLHDLTGSLLYEEVLPESCSCITKPPANYKGENSILIGCENKVIEYQVGTN